MFKKTKCSKCNCDYDEAFNECPKCHSPNEHLSSEFKHVQMLSPVKQISLFVMGLGGFNLIAIIVSAIMVAIGANTLEQGLANMLLNTIVYVILFIILVAIVYKDYKKLGKSFAKWQPYVAGVCCFIAIIVLGLIYSRILAAAGVKITDNDNQQSIDTTSSNFPLTAIVIFGFIGPICEELTYRVGLFSFLKRICKWIAYPVTMVVFALIHFNFEATSITNELLNLPYYLIAAFALTFTYDKFGFAGSVSAHVLNNVISLIPLVVNLGVFH